MKISIIIPTYNSSSYIKKLLSSIPITQNVEVIIVDDYSSDIAELKMVASLFPNVDIYSNNDKKGAGTCRNIGVTHALGEFLIFADSDDFFDADVELVFDNIDELIPKNCEVGYFKPFSISTCGKPSSRHEMYERLVKLHLKCNCEYVRYWFHVPWSKIIRRDFVLSHQLKFSETMVSNDVIFSLLVGIKSTSIISHNLSFYTVLEREGSLTKNPSFLMLNQRLDIVREYNALLEEYRLSEYCIPEVIYLIKMFKLEPIKAIKLAWKSNNLFPNFTYIRSRIANRLCKK